MSGFGDEAQADNHIQVSGCAGTEGTNYFAEDYLVYCSSAATGSDISISLEDATISLPENYVGYSGVWGYHTGTGNINIKVEGGSVTTSILNANGIYGRHQGTGDIDIKVQSGTAVTTSGGNAHGIFGWHSSTGGISIEVQDGTISTSGDNAYGIYGVHQGAGDIGIEVQDSTVSILGGGRRAYGVFGWHSGAGDVNIEVQGSTITTSNDFVNGVVGWQQGVSTSGDVSIEVQDGTISTSGYKAHGIWGENLGLGGISIEVQDGAISTSGDEAYGVFGSHRATGDIGIEVQGGTTVTTEGDGAYGIYGQLSNTGDLDIEVQGGTISTLGGGAHGIYGVHQGAGGFGIEARNSAVSTSGANSYGIYARRTDPGDVSVEVQDSTVSTLGSSAYGIYANKGGAGTINIGAQGGTLTTSGTGAYGIYGRHLSTGTLIIRVEQDGLVTTSGDTAHGIHARHVSGDGSIGVQIENAVVRASGLNAHGIHIEGGYTQTVTVNGEVRGGSGEAAGIFLAGGGRVVIGPYGRVGADSGVAVRASGRGADGRSGPLHLDVALGDRPLQEVLEGRVVNDDGTIEFVANGVTLFDRAGGATGRWAPNGIWDVMAQTAADGGVEFVQVYAPRAALYEALPGLLLRLDAGTPVRRPGEPVWAQVGYGAGSGDPKRSRVGVTYDFDRIEAVAGISRAWGDNLGGSVWLRHLQSEVKVDLPGNSGELELHGIGAGVQAHWREAEGLYVSGELSLTDFDVDAVSARRGRLVRDTGAELWQARLEAGYVMAQGEGLTLRPRAWAWHAEADIDGFTDAVGARVSESDESRSAAGLGVLAEVEQSEYSLYGSLDVENVFAGEETAIQVSGQQLGSESKRTRVLAGMGGRWQGQWVTLRGGLRLADPGGKNQEVSASVSIGGQF